MNVKEQVKNTAQGSVFYSPLKDVYQFVFNHRSWQRRKRKAAFFSQFDLTNDLVFDVGANIGEYTELFVGLGARVVAIEPNVQLAPVLKKVWPTDRVTVECLALGSREGSADLYLCGRDYLSTLSSEWIAVAERSERFSGIHWNEKIAVPVSTLDALIQKYGMPKFIKIDVEGFEKEVLAGLSIAPKFVSFEYNSEIAGAAASCVVMHCFPRDATFNVVAEPSTEFLFDRWVVRDEMLRLLENRDFLTANPNGDIYVCSSR
jgi:FkbM family methyltransferase